MTKDWRKKATILLPIILIYPAYLIIQQIFDPGEPYGWEDLCYAMGAYMLGTGLLIFTIKRLINYKAGTSRYEGAVVLPPAVFGALFLFYSFLQPKIYAYSLTGGTHGFEIWLILAAGIAIFTGLALIPLIKTIRGKKSTGIVDMD